MTSQAERAGRFLASHRPGQPLLLPNAWDVGSAKVFASMGFEAIATTSSGFAATLGRFDGSVSLAEAHEHNVAMVAATDLPVTADYENCYSDDLSGVSSNAQMAVDSGLAGFSIEDYTGDKDAPIYPLDVAVDRVRAAAEAAHSGSAHVVLTARTETAFHGPVDLDDIVMRITAFEGVGADVIYVPGLVEPDDIAAVIESVKAPVNVLARPGGPNVAELAALGVARISVGGLFAFAGMGAVATAAKEFQDAGTYGFAGLARSGVEITKEAFR